MEQYDHRSLGQSLALFHQQEEGPGMVFWHPRGFALFRTVEDYIRKRMSEAGFQEVRTPQVLTRALWEASGHWEKFGEGIYTLGDADQPCALKPMSCPGHIQIFKHGQRSFRDLPLRLAEFGLCHRNEPSGAILGLMRGRSFVQDDAHIFCTPDQVVGEVARFCRFPAVGLCGLRLCGHRGRLFHPPGAAPWRRRALGPGRSRPGGSRSSGGPGLPPAAGRGRVLRPEAGVRAARLPGTALAVRDDPARLCPAGTP